MKKGDQIALAVMALSAMSAEVHAQSSVTLSGRIDTGFAYINQVRGANGTATSRFGEQSGNWGTGFLNLSGTEDLGGGDHAIFYLSKAFKGALGTASTQFRKSWVGLASPTWGTLKMGRDLFVSNGIVDFDPFVQELFSTSSLVRNRTGAQTNSNVTYLSPTFGGFSAVGQYSLGGQAGNWNGTNSGPFGRSDGISLTYKSGPFDVRAIFDELRDANGRFSNVFTASREVMLASNVRLGRFTIQGGGNHIWAPDTPFGLSSTANHFWLGATYQATPAASLTAAVYRIQVGSGAADATHDGSGHATMLEIGGIYNLSKRTFLYANVGYVRNSANSTFTVQSATTPGLNNGSPDNPMPGRAQTGAYTGIMHQF